MLERFDYIKSSEEYHNLRDYVEKLFNMNGARHTSLCENATPYQMTLFIADKLAWSYVGYPPYYEQMSNALKFSLEEACHESSSMD